MSSAKYRCLVGTASAVLVTLSVGHANAAIITAGPQGTHATIQAAIDAAMATPGDDEVRIQSGHWFERVGFTHAIDERMDVSGGWNADFDLQTQDPSATVIDADLAGRTWQTDTYLGAVTLRNLEFTRGLNSYSANVRLAAYGSSLLELSDCRISHGETLTPEGFAGFAGGIEAAALDTSSLRLERCRIHDNSLLAPNSFASGGGLTAGASGSATLLLAELEILDNSVQADGAFGGGLHVATGGQATVQVLDSLIAGNSVNGGPAANLSGSGVQITMSAPAMGADVASLAFRRNLVHANTSDGGAPTHQVYAAVFDGHTLSLSDSEISASPKDGGLHCSQYGTGACVIVNLTLADNVGADLATQGAVSVSNTLADVTELDMQEAVVVNSLLDVDPGYIDRATGDYRLPLSSPAIGAGTMTPIGGLGEFDLDGNARVIGFGVDIGAYEADDPRTFFNGFE